MTTQELVERLTWKAEDQAREASEDRSDGFEYEASIHDKDADLLRAAASRLSEVDAENKRLRDALDEVARPMFHMRKRAEASGQRLSDMAYNIAHSLDHVQAIARAALEHQQKGEGL